MRSCISQEEYVNEILQILYRRLINLNKAQITMCIHITIRHIWPIIAYSSPIKEHIIRFIEVAGFCDLWLSYIFTQRYVRVNPSYSELRRNQFNLHN